MKKLTHKQRELIDMYIKNKKDISDLIEGYSLKDENLSMSIINKLNRRRDDMSNCNFSNAIIGLEGTTTDLSGSNLSGCNFKGARFLGRTIMNNCDLRNVNMNNCDLNFFDYQYADFRGGHFCGCVLKLSGDAGKGAKFDKSILEELAKGWIIQ